MRQPDQSGRTPSSPAVLATTDDWWVLDKPPGWLTVPGRGDPVPVVSDWARANLGETWIVHRLDRETSGVLLLARSAEAHRRASLWFQRHEVRKAYDFLARGRLRAPMLRLSSPLGGAASATQVESREELPGPCFLGRAVPLTGRRHQIRIHLSGQGNPLLGDPEYGGPTTIGALAVGRVALHAARLELPSREVFTAPWPADFAGWVSALRATQQGGADAASRS